eukprot:763006-Hanusia_phi.AAC.2
MAFSSRSASRKPTYTCRKSRRRSCVSGSHRPRENLSDPPVHRPTTHDHPPPRARQQAAPRTPCTAVPPLELSVSEQTGEQTHITSEGGACDQGRLIG